MQMPEGWRTLSLCGKLYPLDRGSGNRPARQQRMKRAKDPTLEERFRQEIADARSGVRPRNPEKPAQSNEIKQKQIG